MNTIFKTLACIAILTTGFLPRDSFAVHFFVEAGKHEFVKGEEFAVVVSLDTDKESVNAVEGVLIYPQDLLEVVEIRDGNSSLNFWIEKPQEVISGEISFSGTTPTGFTNSKAFIYTIVFKVKHDGSGQLALDKLQVLKNDGQGTALPVQSQPFLFSISDEYQSKSSVMSTVQDDDIPEDFKLVVSRDPEVFSNKYILIFSTQDKISGIDHYEVREGRGTWFIQAESPYVLRDQSLAKIIEVKAIDRAGNERIVTMEPINKSENKNQYLKYIILSILIVVCLLWQKIKNLFK